MAKAGKTLVVQDEALELVVRKGYSMAFGARFLKRFIDEHIKLPISAEWKHGSRFDVAVKDDALVVQAGILEVVSVTDSIAYRDVA